MPVRTIGFALAFLWAVSGAAGTMETALVAGDRLSLDAFLDTSIDASLYGRVERVAPAVLGGIVVSGSIEGSASGWFILVHRPNDGIVVGEISAPPIGHLLVRPTRDGGHVVTRVEPADHLECLTDRRHAVRSDGPRPSGTVAGGGPLLVDVMIVYTPSSLATVGGEAAIEALIDSHVAYVNMAYETSGVHHRFRLVHAGEIAYVESGNSLTDLARLRAVSDGFMDDVHPLRDAVGADLVSLINTSGSAGTGYVMETLSARFESSAFSAIGAERAPIPGGLVLAHETGHNMGCNHNNGPGAPDAVFCYSYGHRTPDAQWRTILSGPPGTFLPR